MAWLFETAGFEVGLLEGGYKSYRHYIREKLTANHKLVILSGSTGTGKTAILHELKMLGQQIIDLEGLAHHKGSAFGSLGQEEQPSNEQFENNLFKEISKLDINKTIILEDESAKIGKVVIPREFFLKMRSSPVIRLEMDKSIRVERLILEYAAFEPELLIENVERIRKRLGGQHANTIVDAIENGDFKTAIDRVLVYYDKTYEFGLSKRNKALITFIKTNTGDAHLNAQHLLEFI